MTDYSVAVLLITDGRPCLQDTLASAARYLFPHVDGPTVLVADSHHEFGLSGAIKEGWSRLDGWAQHMKDGGYQPYIFHLEDDFTFDAPVPVADMVALLEREKLTQVALRREAVDGDPPGGFMNTPNYVDRRGWVEAVRNNPHFFYGFTFNPCIYPAFPTVSRGWEGEAGLTAVLPKSSRLGLYGDISDPPRCFHIGVRHPEWKL